MPETYDWDQDAEAEASVGSILEGPRARESALSALRQWAMEPVPIRKVRIVYGLTSLGTVIGDGGWLFAVRNTPMNLWTRVLTGAGLGALGAILLVGQFITVERRRGREAKP